MDPLTAQRRECQVLDEAEQGSATIALAVDWIDHTKCNRISMLGGRGTNQLMQDKLMAFIVLQSRVHSGPRISCGLHVLSREKKRGTQWARQGAEKSQ